MKTQLCAFAAMAALCTGAPASSFSHLDRSDDAEIHSHTALSNDIYVKGFGLSLGVLSAAADEHGGQREPAAVGEGGTAQEQRGLRLPIELLAASADTVGYGGGLASGCAKSASALAPRR